MMTVGKDFFGYQKENVRQTVADILLRQIRMANVVCPVMLAVTPWDSIAANLNMRSSNMPETAWAQESMAVIHANYKDHLTFPLQWCSPCLEIINNHG